MAWFTEDSGGERQRQSQAASSLRPPGYLSAEEQQKQQRQQQEQQRQQQRQAQLQQEQQQRQRLASSSTPSSSSDAASSSNDGGTSYKVPVLSLALIFMFWRVGKRMRAEERQQLIVSLKAAHTKAVASKLAWRKAYQELAAARGFDATMPHPPSEPQQHGFKHLHQQRIQPQQQHLRPGQIATAPPTHHSSANDSGSGFLDPRIAQQAAREEQAALDQMEIGGGSGRKGSTFFGDMAGGTNHFVGMTTGRGDPFPGGGPWRKGGGAASGWTRSRGDGHGRSSATSGCAATAVGLNPRQRWQRAFGGGATGAITSSSSIAATQSVGNDDAAWERLAQRQAARSKATASLDDIDGDSDTASARMSPSKAGAERAAKRLAEIRKEAKELKSKRVDKAIMDELDAAFFAKHLGGGSSSGEQAVQRSGSEGSRADDSATAATSSTSRDQHVSMDNVFLEEQLKEAAEEGREARLQREEREARFNGNSDGIKKAIDELLKERSVNKQAMSTAAGVPDVNGHRDALSASKKDERDREFDRLVEELGVAALGWPSSSATDKAAIAAEVARDVTTSSASASQSQTQSQQVDSEESAPSSSLLDACLDHAAQEGRRICAESSSSFSPSPSNGPATPPLHRSRSSAEYDPHGDLDAPTSVDAAKEARADKLMDEAIEELRKRIESMNDQVGRMNVWADEVHRRMGYQGRYPGSRDKPS